MYRDGYEQTDRGQASGQVLTGHLDRDKVYRDGYEQTDGEQDTQGGGGS